MANCSWGEVMKRIFAMAAAVLLAAAYVFPIQARAVSAQKAILLDGTTGRILYEKDATTSSLIDYLKFFYIKQKTTWAKRP